MLHNKTKWSVLFTDDVPPESGSVIGDFFQAKRGIATGNNDFFIVDKKTIGQYRIPPQFLTPLLPGPRHLKNDRIDSVNGIPSLEQQLFLFSCDLPGEEIRQSFPLLWTYVQNGSTKGVPNGYLCSRRTPWYSCEKSKPAPFIIPYMGRLETNRKIFRFILNNSNALATNGYLLLYPRKQYESCIRNNLVKIWQFLNAIPVESLTKCGRVYGGGLYKIEPGELMRTPAAGIAELLGAESGCFQPEFSF